MAKIKLPSLDGASLLQRTVVYFVTFVFGSAGFVAIASLLVVSAAKSIMPARGSTDSANAADKVAELASGAKTSGKSPRFKKTKTPAEFADPSAVVESN